MEHTRRVSCFKLTDSHTRARTGRRGSTRAHVTFSRVPLVDKQGGIIFFVHEIINVLILFLTVGIVIVFWHKTRKQMWSKKKKNYICFLFGFVAYSQSLSVCMSKFVAGTRGVSLHAKLSVSFYIYSVRVC